MKKLRTVLCLLAVVCAGIGLARGASVAQAATPPSVQVGGQTEIVKTPGQTEFDCKSLFTIDYGSYTADQLAIEYAVSAAGQPVTHDNLVIPFVPGVYALNILIAGKDVNIGVPIIKTIDFELKASAPSFRLKATDGLQTINVQKNQALIDLKLLYRVDGNSFSEDEWVVRYDVKYPGRTVDIFGDYIKSISGVYTVTVSLESKDGSFETVTSTPVTMIVQKARPTVVFEYETESGKETINGEHTTYLYAGTQYVSVNDFFTVYGNAYVRNEYAASLIVKRKESDGTFTNCQTFDGMISPTPGEYHITVKVNPKIQGAFTPVVSDELVLYVKKAVPTVTAKSEVYVTEYDGKDKQVALNNIVSVGNSAYNASQYTVSYRFTSAKKSFDSDQPTVRLENGDWTVTATVTAKNGEFEPQSTTFTLHVDVPMSTGLLLTIILVPCMVVLAGAAVTVTLLVLRKRKKKASAK